MANKFKKAVEQRNEVNSLNQNDSSIKESKENNIQNSTKNISENFDLDSLLVLEDNRKSTKAYYLENTVIQKVKELAKEKSTNSKKINESQIVNQILKSILFSK